MSPLYQARDRIEAQILRDYLDRHLVEAVILNDHLAGAAGGLPADIYPTLWVIEDADVERGRELLDRYLAESAQPAATAPWTCTRCGESVDGDFDICWSCGTARADDDSDRP